MQIPPHGTRVTVSIPQPGAPHWQPGQRLEAVVTRGAQPGGPAEVRIGGLQITLQLPVAASAGDRLQLEVVRAGTRPTLQLLHSTTAPPAPAATNPTSVPPALANALTNLLPAQGSQAPLLAALSAAARNPAAIAGLPPDLQAAILKTLEQIPSLAQALRPETLRQAIHASGLFYEARLAQLAAGANVLARLDGDLKAALLSLATLLRALPGSPTPWPARRNREAAPPRSGSGPVAQGRITGEIAAGGSPPLPETLRAANGQALARLVLHQWSAVENSESGQSRWLLELPLRSGDGVDIVHLLLEREQHRGAPEQEAVWRVELALDLPELGPVHVRIAVAGDRVSTHVWAQEMDTVARVHEALPELRSALEGRRLRVQDLGCHHGKPPPDRHASVNSRSLLDDRA